MSIRQCRPWFFLTVCALIGRSGVTSSVLMTAGDGVVLRTARLVLRQFTLEDAPLLVELDSDPEVMKYISHGKPTPASVIEEKVLPDWLRYYDDKNTEHPNHDNKAQLVGFWAAHHAENDHEFVGWFHLRPDRLCPQELELGYRLKRSVWGRGYATEMSRALIESTSSNSKIVARTLVGNGASIAVMKKCNMLFEGFFEYSASVLPDWSPEERRAVKYSISRNKIS